MSLIATACQSSRVAGARVGAWKSKSRWRRGGAEDRNEILPHLARVADAPRNAQRIEELEYLDGETPAEARRIAELRGGEETIGLRLRGGLGDRCKRRKRGSRIEAVRRHLVEVAALRLAVQEVLDDGLLQLERQLARHAGVGHDLEPPDLGQQAHDVDDVRVLHVDAEPRLPGRSRRGQEEDERERAHVPSVHPSTLPVEAERLRC